MKQAKVSFQLKKTGMQLDEDRNGEKRSVSNQFLVGSDDRPSVRGVLALPPAVHRTDTVHHSTKPEQRCGGRERLSILNPQHAHGAAHPKDPPWRKHQN